LGARLGDSSSKIFRGKLGDEILATKKVSVVDPAAFDDDFDALKKFSRDNVTRWIISHQNGDAERWLITERFQCSLGVFVKKKERFRNDRTAKLLWQIASGWN